MPNRQPKTTAEIISESASDIIQRVSEVEGALSVLDRLGEEDPGYLPDEVLWAIRHARRTLGDAIRSAGIISDMSGNLQGDAHVQ